MVDLFYIYPHPCLLPETREGIHSPYLGEIKEGDKKNKRSKYA